MALPHLRVSRIPPRTQTMEFKLGQARKHAILHSKRWQQRRKPRQVCLREVKHTNIVKCSAHFQAHTHSPTTPPSRRPYPYLDSTRQ